MPWHLPGKEGKIPVTHLPFKAGLTFDIACGATGWLLRENKVQRIRNEKDISVDLTQPQRQIYQRQNGKGG